VPSSRSRRSSSGWSPKGRPRGRLVERVRAGEKGRARDIKVTGPLVAATRQGDPKGREAPMLGGDGIGSGGCIARHRPETIPAGGSSDRDAARAAGVVEPRRRAQPPPSGGIRPAPPAQSRGQPLPPLARPPAPPPAPAVLEPGAINWAAVSEALRGSSIRTAGPLAQELASPRSTVLTRWSLATRVRHLRALALALLDPRHQLAPRVDPSRLTFKTLRTDAEAVTGPRLS
jgi:hypothetical protein